MQNIQANIISLYKKIIKFIFRYFVFLVIFCVSCIIFQKIITQSSIINNLQNNDIILIQKTKLLTEFNKFFNQTTNTNDIIIHVLQNDFENDQGIIKSINNLISYKGFVVPRYFYIYATLPIKKISYFSSGNYDIQELEHFVHNVVFTKKISVKKSLNRSQLPLNIGLIEDFNLQCIFENKFSNQICNYYLNNFLNSFFIYNLSTDYIGLKNIFEIIKNHESTKTMYCNTLFNYLLYTNDKNEPIKSLFTSCGTKYENLFKRTTTFFEIQRTLDAQSFDKISYKDPLLNHYKLLSYQQQIYQDFLIEKIDPYKINIYLDFVKDILKKNLIDPFYKDEIYRYNNYYLKSSLEKIVYQGSLYHQNISQAQISRIITYIHTINQGEPALGFSGLSAQIQNTALLQEQSSTGTTIPLVNQKEKIENKLKTISYLSIDQKIISGSMIFITGSISFTTPKKSEIIKTYIVINYINDMLFLQSIILYNKPEINDIIKNLLVTKIFSLGELYSYISKHLLIYEQENSILSPTTTLCSSFSSLPSITLLGCDDHTISFKKKIDATNTLFYTFFHNTSSLEQFTISDPILDQQIRTSYTNIVKKNYSLSDTIIAILTYEPPQEQISEGTINTLIVFEKIKKYFNKEPNDIAEKSGKILIDLTINNIPFIVNYSFTTNSLGPRYFKNLIVDNKPYMIKNLNLLLDDTNKNTIQSFVIDPLHTIKKIDFTAWKAYNDHF